MEASKCHERPGRNRKATGMSVTRKKYRVGELRPSQVLFTYGIGSIVDLPYISTMVMGLDDWENPYPAMVGEERLLQAVQAVLGPQVLRLLAPPEAPEPVGGLPNPFDENAMVGVPELGRASGRERG